MFRFLAKLFAQPLPNSIKSTTRGHFWNTPNVTALAAGRGFNQEIVGESFYQSAMMKVVGRKAKYQANVYCKVQLKEGEYEGSPCIKAYLQGEQCGSIPASDCAAMLQELRPLLADGKPVVAKGQIMGGFEGGHFGVRLSLSRPLRKMPPPK